MNMRLTIVTQEKELLNTDIDSLTAMTTSGEVTILPGHIPLMTKLADTELIYRLNGKVESFAVTGGFLNVEPNNSVVVLADSAVRSDEINEAKVEEARRKAEETMQKEKLGKTEMFIAEGELRKAILQLKVAQKHKSSNSL